MSLIFKTDNILETLFDIATGGKDIEIWKRTRKRIVHFPDLIQAGSITICFDYNKRPRDAEGRFVSKDKVKV